MKSIKFLIIFLIAFVQVFLTYIFIASTFEEEMVVEQTVMIFDLSFIGKILEAMMGVL